MTRRAATSSAPARIEYLKVRNFRALRDVEFKDLTPLTVLLGPNGSGKSTVFDVFAFLAECFELGLRRAWDKRGRSKELKTRGGDGPVTIEIKYREPGFPLITYHLAVDERAGAPMVVEEWLRWKRGSHGQPFRFLDYREGQGRAVSGELPDLEDQRVDTPLKSADLLAVNALGQFAEHPRVAALRDFITGWYVSYLSADSARGQPEAGPQDRLSRSGDNLANVIQFSGRAASAAAGADLCCAATAGAAHRERLVRNHARWPAVASDQGRAVLPSGAGPLRLRRHLEDAGLPGDAQRSLAAPLHRHRGAGELPPSTPAAELAEECRAAIAQTQLLVTTHSPFFLNGLRPEEVRVLWRDAAGLHPGPASQRSSGRPGVRGGRRPAGPAVDGGPARGGRSPGEPRRPNEASG